MDIGKKIRFETMEHLAKRLNKDGIDKEVINTAVEFFAGHWQGTLDSDLTFRIVDIGYIPDDKTYNKIHEAYSDALYRGFLAGVAAMEELFLFCCEEQEKE